MSTTKKWLIFWLIIIVILGGGAGIVLSGNFPQFTIPFSWFASDDQEEVAKDLPKLTALPLKDVDDQSLLTEVLDKVSDLNSALQEDETNLESSEALNDTFTSVFNGVRSEKLTFNLYRKIYSMVSSQEVSFVEVNLLGFGQELRKDKIVTSQRQLWTFVNTEGERHDYQVNLTYNQKQIQDLTAEVLDEEPTNIITTADTYLDKTADFETAWSDIVSNNSDERLFQEMNKAGLSSDQTEFQALEKEVNITDNEGFYDLFVDTQGDLQTAYLSGFFNTNTPNDGRTYYYFRVPTSQTEVAHFSVSYDRLNDKLLSITKR